MARSIKVNSITVTMAILIGLCVFDLLGIIGPAAAQGYSQEQQQLCSGDAFRLCGSEIPDVGRVTACMIRQRALLSPGCKSVFRYDPPAAVTTPVRVKRPVDIKIKTPKARKLKKKTER